MQLQNPAFQGFPGQQSRAAIEEFCWKFKDNRRRAKKDEKFQSAKEIFAQATISPI
jgi:hypothetical protein